MKAVLISIQPKWCELIASGKKTVEVRKTRPKLQTPFKVYIYCTQKFYRNGDGYFQGKYCGKVIGEFVCDRVDKGILSKSYFVDSINIGYDQTCVSIDEVAKYLDVYGVCGVYDFYGWHISDLVIYDKPKPLSNFIRCPYPWDCGACDYFDGFDMVCNKPKRPPQSWCYVEEVQP